MNTLLSKIAAKHTTDTPPFSPSDDNRWQQQSNNIVDLLKTAPSPLCFSARVKTIGLTTDLEDKIFRANAATCTKHLPSQFFQINRKDEKELASEVLLLRHTFTRLVFKHRVFRQALLTIIQNIYLFKNRKIFFGTAGLAPEQERQEALLLFSNSPQKTTVPLAKTLQHFILARVWDRIVSQASDYLLASEQFAELHGVVERLNTLRNIYMLLSNGLVRKLTMRIAHIYQQSITSEDAFQIGSFGIARAAYRFHPSSGFRFSTYASRWIYKEIQRQSLDGRLIRVSSNLIEQISSAARHRDHEKSQATSERLARATAQLAYSQEQSTLDKQPSSAPGPESICEQKELHSLLSEAIDAILSEKSGDIIRRRYGLGNYRGREQSVIEISKVYGVTRGSIYQLEQTAMKRLKTHLNALQG